VKGLTSIVWVQQPFIISSGEADCLLGEFAITFTGVNGLITIVEGCDTGRAFFGGRIHGFEKDFKPHFFVLFYHLREAGLIDGEPFFPTFFFEFFLPTHTVNDERWTLNDERNQIIENRIEVSILQNE